MVIWVTCGEAELVSTNPKVSFSFVTILRNKRTLWEEKMKNDGGQILNADLGWREKEKRYPETLRGIPRSL